MDFLKKLTHIQNIFCIFIFLLLGAPTPWFDACAHGAPVRVHLVDGLSGSPVSNVKITAQEMLSNGKGKWVASGTTNGQGVVQFDLDGLGQGRTYRFYAKVFNGITSYSEQISAPGQFIFRVGKLKAILISGADGSILSNYKVTLKELMPNGKGKWRASGKTDGNGTIRFDPEGLGKGNTYLLAAKSPLDGSWKYSRPISSQGIFTFKVGNRPVIVTVINGLSKVPLSGLKVTAVRLLRGGKTKWVATRTTDSNGTAVFDLDGLDTGRVFRLYCKPYNGGTVYSKDIVRPGPFLFQVGQIPVRLTDRNTNQPLSGKKLIIYKLKKDKKLKWLKSGTTDENGVVIFDVPGLGTGTRFVVRAERPFGDKKRYYSPWISGPGPVEFQIDRTGTYDLDMEPPWIGFLRPESGAKVPETGFSAYGMVTDNQELGKVRLRILYPDGTISEIPASLEDGGKWHAFLDETLLKQYKGKNIRLEATAIDRALNTSGATLHVAVVSDSSPPSLTLTYPKEAQPVERHGFALSGNIQDETVVKDVIVTLSCSKGDKKNPSRHALFDLAEGKWLVSFPYEDLPGCKDITVHIRALDTSGNTRDVSYQVTTKDRVPDARQLLDRVTFGATPTLLFQTLEKGPEPYFSAQLHPETVDDSFFEKHFGDFKPVKKYDLIDMQLLRSVYSKRQLQEVMTWFWENHFNTDITRHYHIEYELEENSLFRRHALGHFRDLLKISAQSPAMLYYLDNVSNRKEKPNENYARELMELHTLGVDNGYTQEDVVQVARCFTGWRVKDGKFFFDARRHDYGEKRVLGHVIPAGQGIEDGLQVLDILASHPNTAGFICKKLATYLVSDDPDEELIRHCATVFRSTDGDIGQVVSMLVHSEQFNSPFNFHRKVKTPLEFVAGFIRNFSVAPSMKHLRRTLDILGMRPFFYPLPTGWPETGPKWMNSDQYLQRLRFVAKSVFNKNKDSYCKLDPRAFFLQAGVSSPEQMVDYLLEVALSGDYTEKERKSALGFLEKAVAKDFDMNDPEVEQALRELFVLVLSFPEYQLQ